MTSSISLARINKEKTFDQNVNEEETQAVEFMCWLYWCEWLLYTYLSTVWAG
jgi:hypothetical protein